MINKTRTATKGEIVFNGRKTTPLYDFKDIELKLGADFIINPVKEGVYIHDTDCDNGIASVFRRMFDIFEGQSHLKRQELSCMLERLLLNVAKTVEVCGHGMELERSVRYIHSAYNTEIRIPELAKMESLSNSRYITLFNKRMGISPTAYIIKLRMSIACDLLRNTDMSVKQIGILVGYDDAHFFSKLFKKHTGIAPQHYRKNIN